MIGLIIITIVSIGLVVATKDRAAKFSECIQYIRNPHEKSLSDKIFGE
jgi:hypothetical protein